MSHYLHHTTATTLISMIIIYRTFRVICIQRDIHITANIHTHGLHMYKGRHSSVLKLEMSFASVMANKAVPLLDLTNIFTSLVRLVKK